MNREKAGNLEGSVSKAPRMEGEILDCDRYIQMEILLRMPAKSLCKFKCVSKQWLDLISSHSFSLKNTTRVKPHNHSVSAGFYIRSHASHRLIPIPLPGNRGLPSLSFLNNTRHALLLIQDSCNGLFLFSHEERGVYTVCNPTTQKFTEIPKLPDTMLHQDMACLAFDPSASPCYKVVIISYESTVYTINVYSSDDKLWMRLCTTEAPPQRLMRRVFCNGAVHWLTENGFHLQFDIEQKKLMRTPLPEIDPTLGGINLPFIGECYGDLFFISYRVEKEPEFRIHEMRKGTRYWNFTQLEKPDIAPIRPSHKTVFHVLSVLKEPNKIGIVLVLADAKRVFSYNTEFETIKMLYNGTDRGNLYSSACQFIPSLFPV